MRRLLLIRLLYCGAFLMFILICIRVNKQTNKDCDYSVHKNCYKIADNPTGNTERPDFHEQPWPKCEQNLTVSNMSGFSSLPAHVQQFIYYRHCRRFPMLLDVPGKCGGSEGSSDVFLLLVIKSSPGNFDRREVLRKTWARERRHKGLWIRRVFISGVAGAGVEKARLNKLLKTEQREYSDVLQWDFDDSFFNLTLKQILFFEWLKHRCPNVRFLLNGDDDVFANTDGMVEYLSDLPGNNGSGHLYTGFVFFQSVPVRQHTSKYFVPYQITEFDRYPPYCGGGGYILSGHTAAVIHNMSASIEVHPIDDVYVGMCVEKAGLRPSVHVGVKTMGLGSEVGNLDDYDPCFIKNLLLVHRFLPAQIYLMSDIFNDPKLRCGFQFWDDDE